MAPLPWTGSHFQRPVLDTDTMATREELFGGVLTDQRKPSAARAAAAMALGRVATRESELVLLDNVAAAAEPSVQMAILLALGNIGGPRSLGVLGGLHLPARDPRAPAVRFAVTLIAHRLRVDGHDLAPVPVKELLPMPLHEVQAIEVSSVDAECGDRVLADLARRPLGIKYDGRHLVRLACFGRVNVVCPNLDLTRAGGVAGLAVRKVLAGVVVLQSSESHEFSVSYLLMISPGHHPGHVNILAPRCSGRPGLAGTGKVTDDRVEFQLQALARPGARPMELRGEFTGSEFRFRHAVVARKPLAPRRPTWERRTNRDPRPVP